MLRFLVLLLACFASAMRGASAAACADRPTLKLYSGYSSSGTTYLQDEVKYVQNKVGVTADGYYGSGTESAVKSYQRKRSLTADGIVGKNTWQWLCNDYCKVRPTLRYQSGYSSTGTVYLRPFVRYVQGKVGASKDGLYGTGTQSKVEAFQKSKCLSQDGITGPNTWRALCTSYTSCGSTPTPPTSCGSLSNPTSRQSKTACTNRSVDSGTFCWTNRAYWLYQKIQACLPNIECTTYATPVGSGSDHAGNALDCWSKKGRPCAAEGDVRADLDELAQWGRDNAVALKVGFINWRQRMWSQGRASEGWRSYSDRGSCTANHYDHVHFSVCAGSYNEANYGC